MPEDAPEPRGVRSMSGPEPAGRESRPVLLVAIVVVCGFAVAAVLAYGPPHGGHVTPKMAVARAGAARLAMAIEAYQALMNVLPAGADYPAGAFSGGVYENAGLVRQVNSVLDRDPLLRLGEREVNAAGSFVDPWGRPYRVVFWRRGLADRAASCFQVYSCGPGGTWEHGEGDDIRSRW